jgi:putative oxidoreductase
MSVNTMTGDLMHADIRAAAGVNDAILAIGRILIAIIFVSSGVEKFMDLGATTSAIASKSLPYANVLAVLTAIVEAGGGLLIIFGWQTRLAALALAIFCAVAAYFFHDFWNQLPGPQHVNNMIHFMKNVSDRRPADGVRGRRRPLLARRLLHPSGISEDVVANAAASPARCARASLASRYV